MRFLLGLMGAVMLFMYEVLPQGYVWHTETPEIKPDEVFAMWYPLELKQSDGRTFSMDLPVRTNKDSGMTLRTPYEKLDEYEAMENNLEIKIMHGVLVDSQSSVTFDVDTFNKSLHHAVGMMQVQGEGMRLTGGHRLHIIEGGDESYAKECLGYQEGRDVWMFYFKCYADDEETKALIENSIDSIAVN